MKRAVVIGSGFGGLSAAAHLARDGYAVTVLEKNSWVGGRARDLEREGFRFDMGPSWYWMPGEHDRWFETFGMPREQFFDVHRVDPSYRVYFGDTLPGETRNVVDVPADRAGARAVFEQYEHGAGKALDRYLGDCERKYEIAMRSFIYRNFYTIFDFINWTAIRNMTRLNLLQNYAGRIRSHFRHPYLQKILEFPVVFLGSRATRTPAVYTLMNHIDFELGTWYPDGGFSAVVRAMQKVAEAQGVTFRFNHEVTSISVHKGIATGVTVQTGSATPETYEEPADVIVANADYPYVEQTLLPPAYQSISSRRWDRAALAPAVLNYYLGFNRPLDEFAHHTFFFDAPWDQHFDAVYDNPRWIDDPLFYLHVPSRTDPTCAPAGHEAVFLLIPVAPGLEDTDERRRWYLEQALDRIEARTGRSLRENLVFQESMSLRDFERDYHAYKGNAFGLGQTLFQTAWFRMPNRSKKVSNLYFAGQYTVPGTGTTMSMISGAVTAERIRSGR
jgi:phytoene desaturase